MKKIYINPSIQVVVLRHQDIITSSEELPQDQYRIRWSDKGASTRYDIL